MQLNNTKLETDLQENPPTAFVEPVSPSEPEDQIPKKTFPKNLLFVIAGLIVLVLVGFLLARFVFKGDGGASLEPVTITYWGLWEPEPVIQGVIAGFEKENPNIKVIYRKHSKTDYKSRLLSSLVKDQTPDIFRIHNTWLPMFGEYLSSVPNDTVNSLGLENNYFPVASKDLKIGNSYYAIPLMIDNLALYYNKDILSSANKTVPKTWWGLKKTAKELTVRDESGRIQIAGAALGTVSNVDHWSDILGLMIYQNGANPAQPTGRLIEDVLSFYTIFNLQDRVWDSTLPNSTLAFASGKLAFYFGPSWRYFNIKEMNPGLNFGIAKVPQLPELGSSDWEAAEEGKVGLTNINWGTFWVEGVSEKSPNKKAAWKFLEYLSSKEVMENLYSAQSQTRDFGEIYPVVSLAEKLKSNPTLSPFVEQADSAKSWYLCSFTHDNGLNDGIIKYYEDAVNAILNGADPSSVTETLSSGVGQILSRYKINF